MVHKHVKYNKSMVGQIAELGLIVSYIDLPG